MARCTEIFDTRWSFPSPAEPLGFTIEALIIVSDRKADQIKFHKNGEIPLKNNNLTESENQRARFNPLKRMEVLAITRKEKETCFKVKKNIRSDQKINGKLELMNKMVLELRKIEKSNHTLEKNEEKELNY